jgi:hypothetical protein
VGAASVEASLAAVAVLWAAMIAIAYGVWRGRRSPMIADIPGRVWKWSLAAGLAVSAFMVLALLLAL